MIEARPDWVLSRQRAWGVPLTCFTRRGAKPDAPDFLLRDPTVNARIAEAFEAEGADAWYAPGAKERFLGSDHSPDDYDQVFDILDVWFDSGSTHAFVLRDRADGSADGLADLYLEGTDQHRGWFHSSMLQACGTIGRAPYRGVLTHGFTLDARGNKMSKSVGNTVAPEKVVQQYGADILRLWVAQSDYTADLRIGDEILKGVADSYRRLRNTLRFALGSLPADIPALPADLPELERLILHRVWEVDRTVRAAYTAYDFQRAWRAVFDFATTDLSAFYFDIRKDALYCDPADSPRRIAAEATLGILYQHLVHWLAPILVFTAEEVWLDRHPGDDSSVHLTDMPEAPEAWRDDALAERSRIVRAARRVVTGALEEARRDKLIGSSLEAAPVVHLSGEAASTITDPDSFADLCITSAVTLTTDPAPADAFRLDDVPDVAVVFAEAEGEKCQRCWKILPDVGTHSPSRHLRPLRRGAVLIAQRREKTMTHKPDGYPTLSPYLIVADPTAVLDFAAQVFGAERLRVIAHDDGRVVHAECRIDDSVLMMGGAPDAVPAHLHLYLADADDAFDRALAAGAVEVQPMTEQGDGDRRGGVRDPSGTTWWISRQT